jgi:DNA-binding cell septation regulator SpoVG
MEICQMKRFPEGEGNRLAMFSFRLAGLAVHDCLLVEKQNGEKIVIMPRNRKRQDVVHPVGKELREELTKKAIEAYEGK